MNSRIEKMTRRRRVRFAAGLMAMAMIVAGAGWAGAVRIKDIAHIKGMRSNLIQGRGLVVGLNGTGDGTSNEFTAQMLANWLRVSGFTVTPDDMNLKNVAFVLVTAELPAFARPGDRIDVTVSSMGDAKSLQGGELLKTVLRPDAVGPIFAEVQGAISVGGFAAGAGGTGISKNHVTVGKITGGAIVELPSPVKLEGLETIEFVLFQPDFTTAQRVAEVINFGQAEPIAQAVSPAEITVAVPAEFRNRLTEFIASIERLEVHPDQPARVLIDERTGLVVIGEDVRVSTVALAYGSLTIQITRINQLIQPGPFSLGETAVVANTGVDVQEASRKLAVMDEGVTLGEVVQALNMFGLTPRDLISVMQSFKSVGALQAELIIR